jgi:diaminohydroxyphosphoribosylaminopyrimidine deaminase/5-amino-6-(5-phosphoribosylamino)uracil reductase
MEGQWMKQALELAEKGKGWVSPNPLVGAVIVKDGEVIGEGWHAKFGGPHAEAVALAIAGEDAKDATLYVNLEPCSHYGKTPPCADAIIRHKLARVVVAMKDPNPKVAGRGIKRIREAGIVVEVGLMEEEAKSLNRSFIHFITHRTPYCVMKTAVTLDGKTGTTTGDSQWISGEASRVEVHRMRHEMDAILVGTGTALADNPRLTARLEGRVAQPIRVVLDQLGELPRTHHLLANGEAKTIWVVGKHAMAHLELEAIASHVEIMAVNEADDHLDLQELFENLGQKNIASILLESGGGLNAAMLEAGLVEEVVIFMAPKIVGGEKAKTAVEGLGIPVLANCVKLQFDEIRPIGQDLMIRGRVK